MAKYTLSEIQTRLDEKFGLGLITVAPGQVYEGVRKPLRFVDRDFGEWETAVFNLLTNGNTHPERSKQRRKETNLKKYGSENAAASPSVKEKIKTTFDEKYGGNPLSKDHIKEKVKATNIQKYGVAYPVSQSDEVVKKVKATNQERYGVENPAHSQELQEKKKMTNLELYGETTPLKNENVKQRIRDTNQNRLGVSYPMQSETVRNTRRKNTLEKFGVPHHLQRDDIKQKQADTNLARYGFKSPKQASALLLPNGLLISEYLDLHDAPLWQTTAKFVFLKYGFEVLKEHVENKKPWSNDNFLEKSVAEAIGVRTYKKKVGRRFPDFKLSKNLYLDIDGLYWHSDSIQRDKQYHFKKRVNYEERGLRLIQIREDEWHESKEIVMSILRNACNRNTKIFARKLTVDLNVSWKEASSFLEKNHLQGVGPKSKSIGLRDSLGKIFMLLSYRGNAKYGSETLEISRLCTLQGYSVTGGFSRLLKVLKSKCQRIISWCDLRYASGKGYEAVGFTKVRDVQGWKWTDFKKTYNRRACRANMDERFLSEAEYAAELGLVRIYDAGQRLYSMVTV